MYKFYTLYGVGMYKFYTLSYSYVIGYCIQLRLSCVVCSVWWVVGIKRF